MKTLVEIMARSVGARPQQNKNCDVEYLLSIEALEQLIELVRADERNSWPLEMEAMERQVNILTDALAQAKADEREKFCAVLRQMHDAYSLASSPSDRFKKEST